MCGGVGGKGAVGGEAAIFCSTIDCTHKATSVEQGEGTALQLYSYTVQVGVLPKGGGAADLLADPPLACPLSLEKNGGARRGVHPP